jgi:hypothetical protein
VQFGADYQPHIASHGLLIEFSSELDTIAFQQKVWPLISRQSNPF